MVAVLPCFAKREPSWMRVMPLPGNSTYIYVREAGEGATSADALNVAIVHVFENTAKRLGVPFDSQRALTALQSGSDYQVVSAQYNIPVNLIDAYDAKLNNGNHFVTVLCQVVSQRNVAPIWGKGRSASASDNLPALAKSAILPGLGQMGKGYIAGGTFTLVGELALIGSGIGLGNMAVHQLDRMDACIENHDIDGFLAIRADYDSWRTASYFAWGAAGVLYAWNLFRAYTLKPKHESAVAFEPALIYTPSSVSPSVSLTFRF